ncbi:unnamed protein product [Trichobilharzia szidati]|nr:unnamed protein product [Trichobilharzia szidati]
MTLLEECHKKLTDLQRQVAQTSKNVMTRTQKWRRLSAVPSTDCDVVLIFKRGVSEDIVDWLIETIRNRVPQLVVQKQFHRTSGQYALYLTASYRGLLTGAEELRIKKPLLIEHGGGLREFSVEEFGLFDNVMDEKVFLSTSERSNIVYHFLMSLRAHREDSDMCCSIKFTEGQCMIPSLQSGGIVSQIFPLHEPNSLNKLMRTWITGWIVKQPLDDIKEYFGTKVAMYFAWLGHYTYSLIFPSIVGLLVWLFVSPNKNSFYYLLMAILNLIWTPLYLEHWKRTSSFLAYHWSSWDTPIPLLEEPRPLFKGTLSLCPITGRTIRVYPRWKRLLILCFITCPVVLLSLFIVILITLVYVQLQEKMNITANSSRTYLIPSFVLSTLPKIFLAVSIAIMDVSYRKIAVWLTNLENHRLEDDYNNYYVIKLILLQFVNSFYSLFYTAFYLKDLDLLRKQLVTLLLIRQMFDTIKEVFLPYGQSRLRQVWLSLRYEQKRLARKNITTITPELNDSTSSLLVQATKNTGGDEDDQCAMDDIDPEMLIHQRSVPVNNEHKKMSAYSGKSFDNPEETKIAAAEREATLLRYEDPTDDFLEMFIQFGYVSMFAGIFPLAGLLAFANNLIEIRGDAYKLSTSYQRPFAKFASNIGVWQLALDVVSYIAVIVNVALLGISGTAQRLFPNLSTSHLIILLVLIEHAIIITRATISALIPHTPTSVVHQIAKLEHRRREALKILERETMREQQRQQSPSNNMTSESGI